MVWQLPEKIKQFCESIGGSLSKPQFSNVVMILSGVLFGSGRRSLAQFGQFCFCLQIHVIAEKKDVQALL